MSAELYKIALNSFNQSVVVNGILALIVFVLGYFLSKLSLEKTEKLPKDSGKVDIAKVINVRWSGIAGTTLVIAGIVISVTTINSKPIYTAESKDGESSFSLTSLESELDNINSRFISLEGKFEKSLLASVSPVYLSQIEEINRQIRSINRQPNYFSSSLPIDLTTTLGENYTQYGYSLKNDYSLGIGSGTEYLYSADKLFDKNNMIWSFSSRSIGRLSF